MSVPHRTSKRPWGTITKPDDMKLGHQKATDFEVDQLVERLYQVPKERPLTSNRRNPKMSEEAVEDMIERLTRDAKDKAPDARRLPEGKLREIGILNSFAWKGYNY